MSRITRVEIHVFQFDAMNLGMAGGGVGGLSFSRGAKTRLTKYAVAIVTDNGLRGEYVTHWVGSSAALGQTLMLAPLLIGREAEEREGIYDDLKREARQFDHMGHGPLDIALWDLAGKTAGVPLHRLLGGAKRTTLPCYASLLRYTEPPLVAEYCKRALDEGYDAIKLHEVDDAAVAAARAAVPRPVPLMVDVNCEWSPEGAIAAAKRFRRHDLEWLEEPVFPPEDFQALRAAGEASGVPIAAGENFCFTTQFAALFDARAVTFAQPSVTKVGGITEFLKVAALADARGVRVAPHSPYFGPGALATLHLLAARPDARFEYFYLRAEGKLFGAALDPAGGALAVPGGPGLGVDPDPDVIRRFRAD